jgi:hypothetical protein
MKKLLIITLAASLLTPTLVLSDVNRECRGVAAGVVSSMRANNEIEGDDMVKASILAASRACVAALEGFSSEELGISDSSDNLDDDDKYMKKMSVFEFLSQDQGGSAGHDRLKNRRQ